MRFDIKSWLESELFHRILHSLTRRELGAVARTMFFGSERKALTSASYVQYSSVVGHLSQDLLAKIGKKNKQRCADLFLIALLGGKFLSVFLY